MALINISRKKHDGLVSIDLGGRTTKAVEVQRKEDRWVLSRYALVDAPVYEKHLSAELLGEHLKNVTQALGSATKSTSISLNVNDALVRYADMPQMPVSDMRQVLKNNSKAYLQQDLVNYVYDCSLTLSRPAEKPGAEKPKPATTPVLAKMKVLVAGARKQLVEDVQAAARTAGLVPESITPGVIGPANAFELAMPELFRTAAVALVDVGFKGTSICLLQDGELILSRVVNIGGDRLTAGLAESMGISYAEAESIKIGMPGEVQSCLEPLILPLGRELRASIDCFEHQQDRPVTNVFLSGGSAASEFVVQSLQAELMVECKSWNPLSFTELALPPEQAGTIENVASQLTVAVGNAVASL